jgi:hypothetical protein
MKSIGPITVGVVILTAALAGWASVASYRMGDMFQDKDNMKRGSKLPVIWIYLNNSDVNSRSWYDFMGRSSRVINLPFLNLCYETIVEHTKKYYRVEVISGLPDLAGRLGGWEALPEPLRNPEAFVKEPELNWIRAAVLAKFGGLWVSPSTLWIRDFKPLPKDKVVFFGMNVGETYATKTSAPALDIIWSPKPEHPVWVEWEESVRNRLNSRIGGAEFRHDELADFENTLKKYPEEMEVVRLPEISRKGPNRRRIELEDLITTTGSTHASFDIPADAVYLPIPLDELLQREKFSWFLRMSEDQILSSDMVISHLFRKALVLA